MTEHRLMSYLT